MRTRQIPGAEQKLCIAVDANGGEGGLEVILGGVERCLEQDARVRILLAGDRGLLERELPQRLPAPLHSRVELLHAEQVIGEGENLNVSLRRKTRSSLHAIVDALGEGRAQACISSGNSAALVGVAQLRLGVLPTVERTAFCCRLPHESGDSYLLDVGAYVDVPPHRLLQFAFLGAALAAGIYLCGRTARALGRKDPPEVVWDEFSGYWITMFALPPDWPWVLGGLALFRLFDICKPWPVRRLESRGGGLGIMLDDAVAGLLSCALLHLVRHLLAV